MFNGKILALWPNHLSAMDRVQLLDKTFHLFLSEVQIQKAIQRLAKELTAAYEGRPMLLLGILNGSFLVTADLMRHLPTETEVTFIRLSSYGNEMESSGKTHEVLGLNFSLEGRHVIVVEDIVDTGHTIAFLDEHLRQQQPASLEVCSLLYKPDNLVAGHPPHYTGFEIPPEFVVGYGLDYAQHGRGLRAIYRWLGEENETA
ncbi:MAG: hypoxanthine phosphoribosyltransferase [Bacteroidota bacterium]